MKSTVEIFSVTAAEIWSPHNHITVTSNSFVVKVAAKKNNEP